MVGSDRQQFVVSLLFVGRRLLDIATSEIGGADTHLTNVEVAVLLALKVFPSVSQTELAALVVRDKTTISRTMAALEESGFVETRMDPIDGRRKTIDLTEKARTVVAPGLESIAERLKRATAGFTPEEEEACSLFIDRLTEDLSVAEGN